jgi:hypothetical protein
MGYLLFIEIYGVRTVLESVDALVSHMGGTKGRKDNAGSYLSVQIVHRDLYVYPPSYNIPPSPSGNYIFSPAIRKCFLLKHLFCLNFCPFSTYFNL